MSFKVPVKEKNGTMKVNRKRVICRDHESRHALIMENAGSLLTSAVLLAEKAFPHHGTVNCYDHSVFVAEKSLLLAQKLRLKIDARSLIRGALLHDLYLYDWHIPDPEHPHRLHGFFHPAKALRNAAQHFELNALEKDIIRKHMFPLRILHHAPCMGRLGEGGPGLSEIRYASAADRSGKAPLTDLKICLRRYLRKKSLPSSYWMTAILRRSRRT